MSDSRYDVLIDTNVLIYSTLEADDRFLVSRRIVLGTDPQIAKRYVATQNLGEMYPNLTGPKMTTPDSPAMARSKIAAIAGIPGLMVLPLTYDVISLALELCERYEVRRQDYFDMQLVAFMIRHGIPVLLTENAKDFDCVREIETQNPFEQTIS